LFKGVKYYKLFIDSYARLCAGGIDLDPPNPRLCNKVVPPFFLFNK
jgi:hypothetical protein